MAKSQDYGKQEKEKLRAKKKQEKEERKEQRKANSSKGKSLDDMLAYIDEDGNISSTPPDPSKRKEIKVEDIVIGVRDQPKEPADTQRKGTVVFFNAAKGYGFISEPGNDQNVFVHSSNLTEPIKENDRVTFQTEKSARGLTAINVKKI
jgi:cold shock CspA family protein